MLILIWRLLINTTFSNHGPVLYQIIGLPHFIIHSTANLQLPSMEQVKHKSNNMVVRILNRINIANGNRDLVFQVI